MSKCEEVEFPLEGFSNSTEQSLCHFNEWLENFVSSILNYQLPISTGCFLVNNFHFAVLTRRQMRPFPHNILMAAMAVADLFTLSVFIINEIESLLSKSITNDFCVGRSYWAAEMDRFLGCLGSFTIRCSTWISLTMAVIRTLLIRNPFSSNYNSLTKPKFAIFCILLVVSMSFPISTMQYFGSEITKEQYYSCNDTNYNIVESNLFLKNDKIMAKIFSWLDSFFSRTIPCVFFPLVTYFLVKEIRKYEKNKHMKSLTHLNLCGTTTKLIFYITITFFTAEFPLGIDGGLQWIFNDSPGLIRMTGTIGFFFVVLLTINTSFHSIICFLISPQYRKTAKSLVCKKDNTIINVQKVSSF